MPGGRAGEPAGPPPGSPAERTHQLFSRLEAGENGGGAREAMAQELSAISDPGNGAAGNGVATAVAIRQRSSEREQQAPFLRPRHSLSCWPPLPPDRSPAPPRRITQHTFRHTCVRARQQVGGSVSAVPVVSNRGRWWRRWARGK